MVVIATLANTHAQKDLELFLFSLNIWNREKITFVYIYCDSPIYKWLQPQKYNFKIKMKPILDKYGPHLRKEMEKQKGEIFSTKWGDFMGEKMNLLEWVFSEIQEGVFLLDSDICFLAPLQEIDPKYELALSPHYCNSNTSLEVGYYNGGYLWTSNPKFPKEWRDATHNSRFFEQSSLEDMAYLYKEKLFEFPLQVNYGWWRMCYSNNSVENQQKTFGIFRGAEDNSGILVEDLPLVSVHTHFSDKAYKVREFNDFIIKYLRLSATKSKNTAMLVRKLLSLRN